MSIGEPLVISEVYHSRLDNDQAPGCGNLKMNSGTEIPVIAGPDLFDIEVVVQSEYAESFLKVGGPRCEDGVDMIVRAHLRLDDMNPLDDVAVAIS